jgi:hypothetical protein
VKVEGVIDMSWLDELPGVATAARTAEGAIRFRLDGHGLVPELINELCRRGVRIHGVFPHKPSLEDLYFASRKVVRGEMTAVRGDRTVAKNGTAA